MAMEPASQRDQWQQNEISYFNGCEENLKHFLIMMCMEDVPDTIKLNDAALFMQHDPRWTAEATRSEEPWRSAANGQIDIESA